MLYDVIGEVAIRLAAIGDRLVPGLVQVSEDAKGNVEMALPAPL